MENHSRERSAVAITVVLQCGHGPKAVENVPVDASTSSDRRGFNAATARRPWRTSASSTGDSVRRLQASMRPRPEGRGEPSLRRRLASRAIDRFNAATARRPWRTWNGLAVDEGSSASPLQCGHGPKAVENQRPIANTRRARSRASMRPRPEGRGELRDAAPGRSRCCQLLQCGHGPKAVENRESDRQSSRACTASMRPRPEGRGEPPQSSTRSSGRANASMRPRPEGRGEHSTTHTSRQRRPTASMRPRPEGRGERTTDAGGTSRRRFNGATAEGRGEPKPTQAANVNAAGQGFNAATARRPWRTLGIVAMHAYGT